MKVWWQSKLVWLGIGTTLLGLLGVWQEALVASHPLASSLLGVVVGLATVGLRLAARDVLRSK